MNPKRSFATTLPLTGPWRLNYRIYHNPRAAVIGLGMVLSDNQMPIKGFCACMRSKVSPWRGFKVPRTNQECCYLSEYFDLS